MSSSSWTLVTLRPAISSEERQGTLVLSQRARIKPQACCVEVIRLNGVSMRKVLSIGAATVYSDFVEFERLVEREAKAPYHWSKTAGQP